MKQIFLGSLFLLTSSAIAAPTLRCEVRPHGLSQSPAWFKPVDVSSIQECFRLACRAVVQAAQPDATFEGSATMRPSRFRTIQETFAFDANCGRHPEFKARAAAKVVTVGNYRNFRTYRAADIQVDFHDFRTHGRLVDYAGYTMNINHLGVEIESYTWSSRGYLRADVREAAERCNLTVRRKLQSLQANPNAFLFEPSVSPPNLHEYCAFPLQELK